VAEAVSALEFHGYQEVRAYELGWPGRTDIGAIRSADREAPPRNGQGEERGKR
jgi:hypothetical protein